MKERRPSPQQTPEGLVHGQSAGLVTTGSGGPHLGDATSRPSRPLPLPERARWERAFQAPLGWVQAFMGGPEAEEELSGEVALTKDGRVYFRDRRPAVEVVAHEAAHLVQQAGGSPGLQTQSAGPAALELEAQAAAAAALSGQVRPIRLRAGPGPMGFSRGRLRFTLTLRQGPGSETPQIAEVPGGATLTLLRAGEPWCQVRTEEGLEGWMLARRGMEPALTLLEGTGLDGAESSGPAQRGPVSGQAGATPPTANGVGPVLTAPPSAFAQAFNREFASVLHVFRPAGAALAAAEGAGGQQAPGSVSGDGLTDERLERLFTSVQRELLLSFVQTHTIPERLFNGDEVGDTTAQQRILLSAHILSQGRYRPGSEEQRVHARMCFHWAHLVHHYAGATPETGALTDGIMGNSDHNGDLVLGGGDRSQGSQGARSDAPDRQQTRRDRLARAQDALAEAETSGTATPQRLTELQRAVRAAEAAAARSYVRNASLDISQIRGLEPGDWIYYHNDNDSASGDHSVIFSRWLTAEATAPGRGGREVRYRQAEVFSQGLPESGGARHTAWLGDGIADVGNATVHPVTRMSRVPADSRPAASVDELLPLPAHLRGTPPAGSSPAQVAAHERRVDDYAAGLRTQNTRYIRRQARGQAYDEEQVIARLATFLRERNAALIAGLGERASRGQLGLLTTANRPGQPLEDLIRLHERLSGITANLQLTEAGAEAATATFEERHTAGVQRWRDTIRAALDPLDLRLDGANLALQTLRADLSPSTPLARALIESSLVPNLRTRIAHFRSHAPTSTTDAEQELLDGIAADLGLLSPQLLPIRRELARGRGHKPASWTSARQPLSLLEARITVYTRARRDADRQSPYIMTHAGNTGIDVDNETTGLLQQVAGIPWAEVFGA